MHKEHELKMPDLRGKVVLLSVLLVSTTERDPHGGVSLGWVFFSVCCTSLFPLTGLINLGMPLFNHLAAVCGRLASLAGTYYIYFEKTSLPSQCS